MVITDIIIQNIKSIKEPLHITLSEKVTRVAGRNTAGKSAIVDALALFSGVHSMMDIKGLVSTDRPPGEVSRVGIKFQDNTTLWAVIEGNTKVRYHERDYQGETVREWDGWEEEIGDRLGWKTIQKEKLCLNIKKAKVNLLIDTAPTTNSNIMDYLCENRDLEIRISNLEEAHDNLRTATRTVRDRVQYYQSRFESTDEVDINQVQRLYKTVQNLSFTRGIVSNLSEIKEHKEIDIELEGLEKVKQLIQLQRYISSKRELLQINESIGLLEEVTNLVKTQMYGRHKRLESSVDQELGNMTKLGVHVQVLNEMRRTQSLAKLKIEGMVEDSELKTTDNLHRKVREIQDLSKVRQYEQLRGDVDELDLSYGNLNEIHNNLSQLNKIETYKREVRSVGGHLEDIINAGEIVNRTRTITTLSKLRGLVKQEREILDMDKLMEGLVGVLKENDVCPLCNGKIDVENIM